MGLKNYLIDYQQLDQKLFIFALSLYTLEIDLGGKVH